jgi:rSAM/selenodomain-associated transferase 2
MRLSVVIPVLDEEARILQQLNDLEELDGIDEVLVVDGGSTDRTREVVRSRSVRLIEREGGRGPQLNAGAAAASGQALLFLHADVRLPVGAASEIRRVLEGHHAGAFRIRTVDPSGRHPLAPLLPVADLRARVSRLPYGDQAIFVRRPSFQAVGGYPEQPLMEDLELSRRLLRLGPIALAEGRVEVSGRRFLGRPVRTCLMWNLFPLAYRLGVSPERLARLYGVVR